MYSETSLTDAFEQALEQVRIAFADRAMPANASYCPCCHDDAKMQRLLNTPAENLPAEDLNFLVWDAYWTGMDWPSLAYYIPAISCSFAARDCEIEGDMLFYKLLLAAYPDTLASSGRIARAFTAEPMNAAERRSIFDFFLAALEERLNTMSQEDYANAELSEILGFLAAFDTPIEPLLQRWQASENVTARTNLGLLMINYTLNNSEREPILSNSYMGKKLRLLPENQAALDALFAPQNVAAFLTENAALLESIGPDWKTGVGAAFDWAVWQQAGTAG